MTILFLVIGFLLGLAAAAFWRFLGDCLSGWMEDPVPDHPAMPDRLDADTEDSAHAPGGR